jgi:hypothetical protein
MVAFQFRRKLLISYFIEGALPSKRDNGGD